MPTLKALGFVFTVILVLLFMVIGAYALYLVLIATAITAVFFVARAFFSMRST